MKASTRGASSGAPLSSAGSHAVREADRSALAHAFSINAGADDLPHVTDALFVGNGGSLDLVMAGGEQVSLKGIPTGAFLPIAVRRVTGGTATGLVGFHAAVN